MEGFELFDNRSMSRVVDKITITRNYSINFPAAFYRKNNIENKKSALLYYNKGMNQIAIEFKEEIDARGFKITAPNCGKNGGYVTTKSFFTINGLIDNIKTGRYEYSYKEIQKGVDKVELFLLKLECNI